MQLRIIPRIHPFRPFTTSHIKIIWKDRLSFYPKEGLVRTSCRIPTLLLRRCYRKRGYIPMTKETCNSVSEQSMSIQHFRFVFSEDSIACCLMDAMCKRSDLPISLLLMCPLLVLDEQRINETVLVFGALFHPKAYPVADLCLVRQKGR